MTYYDHDNTIAMTMARTMTIRMKMIMMMTTMMLVIMVMMVMRMRMRMNDITTFLRIFETSDDFECSSLLFLCLFLISIDVLLLIHYPH